MGYSRTKSPQTLVPDLMAGLKRLKIPLPKASVRTSPNEMASYIFTTRRRFGPKKIRPGRCQAVEDWSTFFEALLIISIGALMK